MPLAEGAHAKTQRMRSPTRRLFSPLTVDAIGDLSRVWSDSTGTKSLDFLCAFAPLREIACPFGARLITIGE
jgi:hypothetical protein